MTTAQCLYVYTGERNAKGKYQFKCAGCETILWLPDFNEVPKGNCQRFPKPPGFGPGTELMKITSALELQPTDCTCQWKADQMDIWGPEGCEREFDMIVTWLEEAYRRTNWEELLRAVQLSLPVGLYREVYWPKPIPSIVRLAIARARENPGQHR